jgi:hypothetical protein
VGIESLLLGQLRHIFLFFLFVALNECPNDFLQRHNTPATGLLRRK